MKKLFYIICALILLSACAATSYKKAKKEGAEGYFDSKLQNETYDVVFNANGNTSTKIAYDYALLRSAEVCLENGYQTFEIISQADNSKQLGYVINNVVATETIPQINFVIRCSKDKDLPFSAEELRTNLRTKYKL